MPECYAKELGDCEGRIEDEHFVPIAMQRFLGEVNLEGFPWLEGATSNALPPSAYAHARMICTRHHDLLDGLDGIAAAYFRNLMFIAGANNLATGAPGRIEDIAPNIDGRSLERWMLKTICGALAAGSVAGVRALPLAWLRVLFNHVTWPQPWSMPMPMIYTLN